MRERKTRKWETFIFRMQDLGKGAEITGSEMFSIGRIFDYKGHIHSPPPYSCGILPLLFLFSTEFFSFYFEPSPHDRESPGKYP